jgi:flagellar FliL protein
MAKKKDDAAAKGGGPKKFAVPIVCVLIGVFAGPKVMGGGAAAGADPTTTTTTAPGPVVTMDSTTLNLADGHLLKVGIALQISASWEAEHAEEGGGHGEEEASSGAAADPTHGYARAMDAAISIFGGMTYDQLLAPGGKNIARSALEDRLAIDYEGEIESVLFYEFVMQ